MADSTAVFDPNVFAFGFDTIDEVPVVARVTVEPEFGRVAAGQDVSIAVYIIDVTTSPGKRYPLDPSTAPTIELYGPLDTVVLSATPMIQVGEGVYSYSRLVTESDAVGPYTAVFRCVNGTVDTKTKKQLVFVIV